MKQIFLLTSGFSRSGKSTFAKRILNTFPDSFIRIRSDDIRHFINETYPLFKDDNTVDSKIYPIRERTVKKVQSVMLEALLLEGVSVILDACNLERELRASIFKKAKEINPNITTGIIYTKIPQERLFENIRREESEFVARGEKAISMDRYEKIQKPRFVEPTPDEAEYLFTYNWDNGDEVIGQIRSVLQKP